MTASRKWAHDKVFKNKFTKRPFKKNIALQSKKVIALNLYIDINELVYKVGDENFLHDKVC